MMKVSKDFSKILNLYLIDEIVNPFFSIKSINTDQWYWSSYEYPE